MNKKYLILVLMSLICSCHQGGELKKFIDYQSFEYIGGTLFSTPSQVTMKEIHLDKGLLFGQEVMLKGTIMEIGSYQTYMVLSDNTARMLVVLTNLDFYDVIGEDSLQGEEVKILGVVDYGKKGLPYILAKSIVVDKKIA
ncbi:MAG: hypothetical protein AB8G05_01960 [Oligoflexales bacterium]